MGTLYNRLKTICEEHGTTLTGMCQSIGISKSLLGRLKNSDSMNAKTAAKIAAYFGCTVESILGGELPSTALKVPVIGVTAAGIPITAEENIIDMEECRPEMAAGRELVCLQVRGDSMAPSICDGDRLIVRIQSDADQGDVVVALINGDATVKRLHLDEDGSVTLVPNNPEYSEHRYTVKEQAELGFRIFGKALEVRRPL